MAIIQDGRLQKRKAVNSPRGIVDAKFMILHSILPHCCTMNQMVHKVKVMRTCNEYERMTRFHISTTTGRKTAFGIHRLCACFFVCFTFLMYMYMLFSQSAKFVKTFPFHSLLFHSRTKNLRQLAIKFIYTGRNFENYLGILITGRYTYFNEGYIS